MMLSGLRWGPGRLWPPGAPSARKIMSIDNRLREPRCGTAFLHSGEVAEQIRMGPAYPIYLPVGCQGLANAPPAHIMVQIRWDVWPLEHVLCMLIRVIFLIVLPRLLPKTARQGIARAAGSMWLHCCCARGLARSRGCANHNFINPPLARDGAKLGVWRKGRLRHAERH